MPKKFSTRYSAYKRHHIKRAKKLRNHPFVVPVTTFLVLFFITASASIFLNAQTVGASDSHVVRLSVDGEQRIVPTRAATVGDLLKRLDISVKAEDIVEPTVDTPIIQDNFTVNVYKARPITILYNNHKITVLTPYQDLREIVTKAGISLQPEDDVKVVSSEKLLSQGDITEQLMIDPSLLVKLSLYGQTVDVRTHAKTVGDLLKERGIDGSKSTVFPTSETLVASNSAVFVTDPGKNVTVSEEEIPFGTTYVDNFNLLVGVTQTQSEGRPGKKAVVYEISKTDPTQKTALQDVLINQPVDKVIARGRKVNTASVAGDKAALLASAGISPNEYTAADFIIGRESGWRPGALNARGCAGLGQACPGSKVINACPNWSNDPVCQLKFFTGYANSRHGGWNGAYQFWLLNHWW